MQDNNIKNTESMDSAVEKFLLATVTEQRRARRWRVFFRLIWLLIFLVIISSYLITNKFNLDNNKKPQIATINLSGVIGADTETYRVIATSLKNALKDDKTIAVIIRANSPGGSPVYSDMLYQQILTLRKQYPQKPIIVAVEEVCASGCYYIAAAANQIYANPASIVGSIGVIYTGFGATGLMQKLGIDSRLLIAGNNKAMGYPFAPAKPQQTQMHQQMLNEIHQQFINAVKLGRGKRLTLHEPQLFSGRYWLGVDAKKLGLIDGFASVDLIAQEQFHSDNLVDFTVRADPFDRFVKKIGLSAKVFFANQLSAMAPLFKS